VRVKKVQQLTPETINAAEHYNTATAAEENTK